MEETAIRQFQDLETHHWWFRGRRAVYFALLESVQDDRSGPVLDVGTGAGGFLEGLGRWGRVVACDLVPADLVFVAERGLSDTVAGDAASLPFADAAFGTLSLFDAIEHTEDDVAVLREALRVVRPGGRAIVSVPAHPFLFSNNDRVARHHRRYSRRVLRQRLREAGWEIERATFANALLFPLILPAVLLIKAKEAVFPRVLDTTTNLTWRYPRWLNSALAAVFSLERFLVRHFDVPLGHSLAAVARRPD